MILSYSWGCLSLTTVFQPINSLAFLRRTKSRCNISCLILRSHLHFNYYSSYRLHAFCYLSDCIYHYFVLLGHHSLLFTVLAEAMWKSKDLFPTLSVPVVHLWKPVQFICLNIMFTKKGKKIISITKTTQRKMSPVYICYPLRLQWFFQVIWNS